MVFRIKLPLGFVFIAILCVSLALSEKVDLQLLRVLPDLIKVNYKFGRGKYACLDASAVVCGICNTGFIRFIFFGICFVFYLVVFVVVYLFFFLLQCNRQ